MPARSGSRSPASSGSPTRRWDSPSVNLRTTPNVSRHLLRIAVTVGFILLIAAFHLIQPYRLLFFSHEQLPLLLHSLGRLVFCGYVFFAIALSDLLDPWLFHARCFLPRLPSCTAWFRAAAATPSLLWRQQPSLRLASS